MEITKQCISDFYHNDENLFLIWNTDDKVSIWDSFYQMDQVILVITLTGEIEYQTSLYKRTVSDGSLIFLTNNSTASFTKISSDFKCMGIVFSKEFWTDTLIHAHPYTTLSLVHPALSLTDSQLKVILNFVEFIKMAKDMGMKDKEPLMKYLVLGMFSEIGKMYEEWSDNFPKRSAQNIMREFAHLLYTNYKNHRDVEFYANTLSISKRHFSAMVKSATGMTAFKCIEMYVILKASSMLRNTTMSVKEIAFELNFDDTSHFCKYFRKNMNMSPESYRRQSI